MNSTTEEFVLQYVNAPCGAGKTYQIIQTIYALYKAQSTDKVFYEAPTVALIKQTYQELKKLGVPVVSIYVEKLDEHQTVKGEIFKALREREGFLTLCVTYAGFESTAIDFSEKMKSRIRVFCDEIPNVNRYERLLIPYSYRHLLMPIVKTVSCPKDELIELIAKDIDEVKKFARHQTDDGEKPTKELIRELAKGYRVFTRREQWEKLTANDVDNDYHGEYTYKNSSDVVVMHNIGIYKGFKKVVFFGANADKTMFLEYHRSKSNVIAEDITDKYVGKLRYMEHPNGDKLKVVYIFPQRIWSRNKAGSFYDDNSVMTQLDEFLVKASNYAANLHVPYGYVCNNNSHNNPEIEELFKKHFPQGERIPVRAHGSNDYAHLKCIVISPWLNLTPMESNMLELIGLSREHQTQDLTYGTYYQGMMRGSLRNPDCQDPFTLIVPVEGQALAMAEFFTGGVTIESIDGRISRRTKSVNRLSRKDEDRRRKWRASQRELSKRGIFLQEEGDLGVNHRVSEKDLSFGNPVNRPQNSPYEGLDLEGLVSKHGFNTGIRLYISQMKAIDKELGLYDEDPPPPPPELNFGIKVFRSKYDPSGGNAGTPISLDNVVWFAEFIRHWNENTFIPSKDKNFLFSPALFKEGVTTRTLDDVEAVKP